MIAVSIGAQTIEPAKRLFILQSCAGFGVDNFDFLAAKRPAILYRLHDLFMLDMQRLDPDRHNRQGDKQKHRQRRRPDKGQEGAVRHVACLALAEK